MLNIFCYFITQILKMDLTLKPPGTQYYMFPPGVWAVSFTTDAPWPHLYILPDPPGRGNLYAILR